MQLYECGEKYAEWLLCRQDEKTKMTEGSRGGGGAVLETPSDGNVDAIFSALRI